MKDRKDSSQEPLNEAFGTQADAANESADNADKTNAHNAKNANGASSNKADRANSGNASSANDDKDELINLQIQFADLQDRYVRANAEFENIKKRLEKEKNSALTYANESFAKDLLDVLDALEAAASMQASDEESKKFKEGVQNTLDLFLAKLAKHGVKVIATSDEFDPNLHEAMMNVDSPEHSSSQIVSVLQKGYQMNDRVIRPTKVSVAK